MIALALLLLACAGIVHTLQKRHIRRTSEARAWRMLQAAHEGKCREVS